MSTEQNQHKLKPERIVFVKAVTSVHAGAGSGVEHIDLPIQREQPTKFPVIYGSSFKGSLREHAIRVVWNQLTNNCRNVISLSDIDKLIEQVDLGENQNRKKEICENFFSKILIRAKNRDYFDNLKNEVLNNLCIKTESISRCIKIEDTESGPKVEIQKDCLNQGFCKKIEDLTKIFGSQDNRGKVTFTDLRILLFPVKSLKGVFAYVTCPYVLKRFKEHVSGLIPDLEIPEFSFGEEEEGKFQVYVTEGSDLVLNNENVVLEEFAFKVNERKIKTGDNSSDNNLNLSKFFDLLKNGSLYEPEKRFVVVSDEVFAFMVQSYTEVVTRIKINPETGTVQEGALWTEEYLPTETVLYSVLFRLEGEQNLNVDEYLPKDILNLGGNQTIGKGIVKVWNYPNNLDSEPSSDSTSEPSNNGGKGR